MSADDLLPITEADVVPGAEFEVDGDWRTVVAVDRVWIYWRRGFVKGAGVTSREMAGHWRKRAPKPPRHTVELRPPKKGERYVWSDSKLTPLYDYPTDSPRWVIVDDEVES